MCNLKEETSKESIIRICRQLYQKGYVVSFDGNVSIRQNKHILITPTHVCKGFLTLNDIIEVDLSGRVLHGIKKPSSEIQLHLELYKANPAINAIVHAHPLYATAIYRDIEYIDRDILVESKIMFPENIPVIKYVPEGSFELARHTAHQANNQSKCCILERHGSVTWGTDIDEAFFRTESLERLATTAYLINK